MTVSQDNKFKSKIATRQMLFSPYNEGELKLNGLFVDLALGIGSSHF